MSAIASAGAAAWVAPEILTAKPAGGATLSGPTLLTGGNTGTAVGVPRGGSGHDPDPVATGASGGPTRAVVDGTRADPATTPRPRAFTGLDIQRDAEIGAALVAGGWALQHWASRTPAGRTPRAPAESPGDQPDRWGSSAGGCIALRT